MLEPRGLSAGASCGLNQLDQRRQHPARRVRRPLPTRLFHDLQLGLVRESASPKSAISERRSNWAQQVTELHFQTKSLKSTCCGPSSRVSVLLSKQSQSEGGGRSADCHRHRWPKASTGPSLAHCRLEQANGSTHRTLHVLIAGQSLPRPRRSCADANHCRLLRRRPIVKLAAVCSARRIQGACAAAPKNFRWRRRRRALCSCRQYLLLLCRCDFLSRVELQLFSTSQHLHSTSKATATHNLGAQKRAATSFNTTLAAPFSL